MVRNVAEGEVKLLMLTEGRVILLVPSTLAASRGSSDSIDKLFDDGKDAGQEHPFKKDDDVLIETIAKDTSEVVVKKTKKSKQKRKMTGDARVSIFPPKKLREDYHAATPNISWKSLATIRSLIPAGSSVSSEVMEPRNDRESPIADAPVMTIAVTTTIAANVFVVSVSKDKVNSSKLNEPVTLSDSFYASQDLDSETLHSIYVPKWKLYTKFNVGVARKMCLRAEVRMRAEHTLKQKDKLEDKCAEQAALLSEKDAEIANLKSLLSLKEAWIDHGKAGRDLYVVEAYDAIRYKQICCIKKPELRILSFWKGPLAEILRAEELKPSLEQLMLHIHRAEDDVASTSAISATAGPINTLSTTFVSSGVVPPLSVSDYQVLDAEPHHEDPPFVTFEEEELDTTLELRTSHVRGKMFPLWSLSLYVPLPNASVTSYGPSHLGPSLPPSSAWLASLFR
ncbi:hypothetical protein Tco_0694769 [Tanacetum coccineum]